MWCDTERIEVGNGKTTEILGCLWNTLRRLRRGKGVVIGGLRVMLNGNELLLAELKGFS
jgi:hypothetical protein